MRFLSSSTNLRKTYYLDIIKLDSERLMRSYSHLYQYPFAIFISIPLLAPRVFFLPPDPPGALFNLQFFTRPQVLVSWRIVARENSTKFSLNHWIRFFTFSESQRKSNFFCRCRPQFFIHELPSRRKKRKTFARNFQRDSMLYMSEQNYRFTSWVKYQMAI